MVFLPVPWYSIYPASVDPDWLAGVVLRHAAFVAAAAAAARSIQALVRRREVAQFESACLASVGDDAALNKGNVCDDDDDECDNVGDASLPPPDDFATHLSACARDVFGVPTLRPRQVEAASKLIFDRSCRGRLLVVDRTGGGKSLILHTVAACVAGVSLVIVPLLSLTADQLSRLQSASQTHGSVKAVHLDEVPDNVVRVSLLQKLRGMRTDDSETLALFC